MSNVNKDFLRFYDANDLGQKTNKELVEIRAAFVAGYNRYARVVDDLWLLVTSLEAPSITELRIQEDLVHDYYERIYSKLEYEFQES